MPPNNDMSFSSVSIHFGYWPNVILLIKCIITLGLLLQLMRVFIFMLKKDLYKYYDKINTNLTSVKNGIVLLIAVWILEVSYSLSSSFIEIILFIHRRSNMVNKSSLSNDPVREILQHYWQPVITTAWIILCIVTGYFILLSLVKKIDGTFGGDRGHSPEGVQRLQEPQNDVKR